MLEMEKCLLPFFISGKEAYGAETGDVINGSKRRQITKYRISLEIFERCSSNLTLVIYIKQGIN